MINIPINTSRSSSCISCIHWDMNPKRGRDLGICIAGKGETLCTDGFLCVGYEEETREIKPQ